MKLVIIAAHDKNLVIGKDGALPWHIPEDLKHFKRTTTGHTVLMGRIVFEELGEKPLPNRKNVVLTSRSYSQVAHFGSIEKALDYLRDEPVVFIIGGGEIYRQMIPMAHKMIITEVHEEYAGDTFFPDYRPDIGKIWLETSREDHKNYSFIEYERREIE
ncbi:MAG: dihydrofolate reductase [Rhodothermaceae bacterium]|nr:dihydrofolate reductase [Rhodothermaceae bacterium]